MFLFHEVKNSSSHSFYTDIMKSQYSYRAALKKVIYASQYNVWLNAAYRPYRYHTLSGWMLAVCNSHAGRFVTLLAVDVNGNAFLCALQPVTAEVT